MMADYVVTCMTSPMYTYEDAPVYTLMESNVTKAVINRAGFNTGTGLSTTGGSTGNQVAIFLSYIKKSPETKRDGNFGVGAPGVIFCSELAHYSTPKGSFYQGIKIKCTRPIISSSNSENHRHGLSTDIMTGIFRDRPGELDFGES